MVSLRSGIFLQFSVVEFLAATNGESSRQTMNSHCLLACLPLPYSLGGGPHIKHFFMYCWELIRCYRNVSAATLTRTLRLQLLRLYLFPQKRLSWTYLATTASSRSSISTFAVMSKYNIWWQYKIMWDTGFWQQILWSLLSYSLSG
jgi:hypothetical protein